jgi:hypothetical protein
MLLDYVDDLRIELVLERQIHPLLHMRDDYQCAHRRRQLVVRIVAGAHVLGEIFRLHQFADIMEISADSAQCRIGPDGFRGRLGEVGHGQAVVVRFPGPPSSGVGAMDD